MREIEVSREGLEGLSPAEQSAIILNRMVDKLEAESQERLELLVKCYQKLIVSYDSSTNLELETYLEAAGRLDEDVKHG